MLLILTLFYFCRLATSHQRIQDYPQYYIKIAQVNCEFNPEWVTNVSCKLKPINWEKTLGYGSVDIIKPFRNITINGQVFRRETRYVPYLVNVTKNACDIFNHKGVDFYAKVVLDLLKNFSNLKNPSCPLTGHVEVKNAFIDAGPFKFLLTPGMYKINLTLTEGEVIGSLELICVVADKRRRIKQDPVVPSK